ncbi:hypothetical protein [Burkholderia sp. AU16741]|uniref:hypothetical protein n=1 Tax=Burkholderia sp. AU16741 TaxID=2015347 RepID=UPI0015C665E3|nr:hypothetical protein [Burkholderia sp. AU16741]
MGQEVAYLQQQFDALLATQRDFRTIVECLRNAGLSAAVVGGWARDLLMGRAPHDIDMVVFGAESKQLEKILPPAKRRTAFGGVAFEYGDIEIDLWSLESTYLIREFELELTLETLMQVIDFNINTLLFSPRQFAPEPHAMQAGALEAFERKEIDFNCGVVPLPVAQVSRLAYFSAKLEFTLAPRVRQFMRQQCVERSLRAEVEANLRQYCPVQYRDATLKILNEAVDRHDQI